MFVLSVAVLLANDHVLKAAWPGLVTGKLSDVAGVSMVAVLLTAAFARPSIGFGVTATSFALLKTVPLVAILAAPVLGGVTRTDSTDLVALVVLVPLWRWVERSGARPVGLGRSWLIAVQLVAVGSAVFTTTATGCGEEGVSAIAVDQGVVAAVGAGATSTDGGRTWRSARGGGSLSREPRVSCVDGLCVEVDYGSVVERRGGETTMLLDVEAQLAQLERLDPPGCPASPFGGVAVVDVADGRHVVVAMGWLGTLHRGPDEAWEWVAVGGLGVQDTDATPIRWASRWPRRSARRVSVSASRHGRSCSR